MLVVLEVGESFIILIFCHGLRYLDFNDETLSWMMVVDVCFLLEFLQMFNTTNQAPMKLPSMFHLYGNQPKKSSNGDVVKDVMMLENQLPLFLLNEILNLMAAPSPSDTASTASDIYPNNSLETMVTNLLKGLTLFKPVDVSPRIDIITTPRAHLLDVLYHVLVPISPSPGDVNGAPIEYMGGTSSTKETPPQSTYMKQLLKSMYITLNIAPVRFVKGIVTSRPMSVMLSIPWNLLRPWWASAEANVKKKILGDHEEGKPPQVEEILIPSVKELVGAGVRFRATDGGVSTIAFDPRTATFSLPSVTVDGTTEVILRNLIAYESFSTCGPELVLARYAELMKGIIDTEEDVVLLRQIGVVNNRMRSDTEAAEMWNGMCKSVRLTRVGYLDAAIRAVNAYYNGRWKVRAKRVMKSYVYRSWKLLTLVAALLLLLLNTLQAVCSVYSCGPWIRVKLPAA